MKKDEIKSLLMSMRSAENESVINYLLGKIDMMDDHSIEEAANKVGNNESSLREFFTRKIAEVQERNTHEEHKPINEMFTYGISGGCVHLHLPGDLHRMLSEKGFSGTMDTVNLYLLDAIDKINNSRNLGRFQGQDSIYMISPILLGREMKFLDGLDFETHSYRKGKLSDKDFISNNPEASLAVSIFGDDKNIGTAKIGFDKINSKEWQEKKKQAISKFASKGITLDSDSVSR